MSPDEPELEPTEPTAEPGSSNGHGTPASDRAIRLNIIDDRDLPAPDAGDEGDDDPDDAFDPEEEDEAYEEIEDTPRSVLITGASGNLGRKLRAAWEDAYDLVLIDRDAGPGESDVIEADLSLWDEEWIDHFHGVDTVIHLAANPDEFATWEGLEGPNLDALANVLLASALAGVERVIFASSNHVMGGYRELGDMPITADLPPRPGNPYGASKLMGERMGLALSNAFDLTFLALRLGWVQPGDNRPDTLPDPWARSIWLSNRDLIRLFEAAVEADLGDLSFAVLNGLSNNRGSRWDIAQAAELIGYYPEDDAEDEDDLIDR